MRLARFILVIVFGCIFFQSFASDSSSIFVLTKSEIESNNITNMEEAVQLLPFFYQLRSPNQTTTATGNLPGYQIAVYKDDFPVMLDQNTGYDLRAIPVWDLDRIEVHTSSINIGIKNSSYIVIKLYTTVNKDQPIAGAFQLVNSSANDLHTALTLQLNNKVHSGQVGINRSFTSSLYKEQSTRTNAINAAERYDINLKYRYKILKSMTLEVASNNSMLLSKNKGDIIEGTSRVRDINTQFNSHNLTTSLTTALSKFHTLSLNGLIQRVNNDVTTWDKDLSTQTTGQFLEKSENYSTGYDYGYMQLLLKSFGQKLNYTFGIELSNTIDNRYSTINAIATEYSDYSFFGMFEYQFKNTFKLEGGVKALSNNLTNTRVMPSGKITLAPNKDLQLSACFQKGLSYPLFSQWFYPTEFTNTSTNNILLEPIDQSTVNFNLLIYKGDLLFNSGIMYNLQSKIPRGNPKLQNQAKTSGNVTYLSLQYDTDWFDIQPSLMLHGSNGVLDTTGLTFFQPEFNIRGTVKVPNTNLTINMLGKFIGKRTSSLLVNDTINLTEFNSFNHLNSGIDYKFMGDKLSIGFGINNLLNSVFVDRTVFTLTEIAQTQIQNSILVSNRPRSFFFRVSYSI